MHAPSPAHAVPRCHDQPRSRFLCNLDAGRNGQTVGIAGEHGTARGASSRTTFAEMDNAEIKQTVIGEHVDRVRC